MEIILLTIALTAIAFLAIGFNIFFRKNGKFPETEVGRNRHMRNLGITCPKCDEIHAWKMEQKKKKLVIRPAELKLDRGRNQ
jgi:hypothetical protein